jgi:hypothetical protein
MINYAFLFISQLDSRNLPKSDPSDVMGDVLRFVFGLAAAITLIMIAVSGLRYTLSRGDATKIKTAKESLIYAIAGFFIAVAGFSIVTFVYGRIL